MSPFLKIDLEAGKVTLEEEGGRREFKLGTPEAFSIVNKAWLRCGWDNKYVYNFSWMGRPVIQLPEDLFRVQEVIFSIRPQFIIETGVAHGGSLVFYASLLKILGGGRVIGIDKEIRSHNRKALEGHFLYECITLFEGDSTDPRLFVGVSSLLKPSDKVMVILDSNHSKAHVLEELQLYSSLVSVGSYLVVADGIMEDLVGAPYSQKDWEWNNPKAAVQEFLKHNHEFVLEDPKIPFNEGNNLERATYWKDGWLRRISKNP